MRETIRLIGRSIRAGSRYLPTRNLAARWAARAAPKDYLGQAVSVYRNFLKHWRYVKDPLTRELVTASPSASYQLVMAGDGIGMGDGRGAGDCDCATVALGSLYEAIGLPVRIATIAKPSAPPGQLMDHVYPEVNVPKIGWIPADPVIHPRGGFGDSPPASRKVVYSLAGDIIEYSGNLGSILGQKGIKMNTPTVWQRPPWRTYGDASEDSYSDYSQGFFGAQDDGIPLEDWSTVGLADWGYLEPKMGMLGGGNLQVEVGPDQTMFYSGLARTPMVELSPADYNHLAIHGQPYDGMFGLGDDGEVYVYEGLGGFFKRLFKKAKKAVKKVGKAIGKGVKKGASFLKKRIAKFGPAKYITKFTKGLRIAKKVGGRIRRGLRRVVKRLPGGKALIRIGGKIKKVAMRVVKPIRRVLRPMSRVVGKWAPRLAPIASFIPGYGPAIAAGMRIAGKAAKMYNVYDQLRRGKIPASARGEITKRLTQAVGPNIPGLFGEATPAAQATMAELAPYMARN